MKIIFNTYQLLTFIIVFILLLENFFHHLQSLKSLILCMRVCMYTSFTDPLSICCNLIILINKD